MANNQTVLVVNADDFGLSEPINAGIISAFDQGIVRSTSLMPNGQAFDNAVNLAKERPELGVGIHISLVDEKPISSALNGLPTSYKALALCLLTGRIGRRDLTTECCAQIEKVLSTGIRPTHLDSHQHVHIHPVLSSIIIDLAVQYAIPGIRVPLDNSASKLNARGMQIAVSRMLSRMLSKKATNAGLRIVDRFFGLAESGHITENVILQAIAKSSNGINELMCHPGFGDPQTSGRYKWGYTWDAEVKALCSEQVISAILEHRVTLCSFAQAWK
jgi:predicted glycoside hydrolase/deacetylase ChbG (UPF0249 family)